MKHKAFEMLLQMLQLRKDRTTAETRRTQVQYQRARQFNQQIDDYATEYEGQWVGSAVKGETVMQLRASAAFGEKLRATVRSQLPEVNALELQSKAALAQLAQDTQRVKTLKAYLKKVEHQLFLAQEKRERLAVEDHLLSKFSSR